MGQEVLPMSRVQAPRNHQTQLLQRRERVSRHLPVPEHQVHEVLLLPPIPREAALEGCRSPRGQSSILCSASCWGHKLQQPPQGLRSAQQHAVPPQP